MLSRELLGRGTGFDVRLQHEFSRTAIEICPNNCGDCYTWSARLRNQVTYYILDRNCKLILPVIHHYQQQWKLAPYRHIYASNVRLRHISQQPAAFDFP